MKSITAYRTGGKSKGGRPIINQYTMGLTEDSHSFSFLKYLFLILIIVGLIYLIYYLQVNGLIVWFDHSLISEKTIVFVGFHTAENEYEHYLWNILNVLLIGVFLSAIAPVSGKKSFYVSIFLIVCVYLLGILNMGYIGLDLILNFDFLISKRYISNNIQGVIFFIQNLYFFLMVFAISFLIEAETD